jgi:hypothetical protein
MERSLTVELIACLARRRQPARLMVVCSLRPADLIVHDHALRAVRQDLQANGQCEYLPLELLTTADVTAYLSARFDMGSAAALRRLAALVTRPDRGKRALHGERGERPRRTRASRRTGWPLAHGRVDRKRDRRHPHGASELLLRRIADLVPGARRALEAGSVAGDEFAVAMVAAALGDDVDRVEDTFEGLAAQGTLIAGAGIAEWPDGSLTGRYRFRHALNTGASSMTASARLVAFRCTGRSGFREEARVRGGGVRARGRARDAFHARSRSWPRARVHTRSRDRPPSRATPRTRPSPTSRPHSTRSAHESDGSARAERELGLVTTLATLPHGHAGLCAVETERGLCARAGALATPCRPPHSATWSCAGSSRTVTYAPSCRSRTSWASSSLRTAAQHPDARVLRVQAH